MLKGVFNCHDIDIRQQYRVAKQQKLLHTRGVGVLNFSTKNNGTCISMLRVGINAFYLGNAGHTLTN
jgi:hypothetical protein